MLAIISPAKRLDYDENVNTKSFSIPERLEESEILIKKLRTLSKKKIGELMNLSKDLATLNHERYANWDTNINESNAKQAVLAFRGDAYLGLSPETFSEDDFSYAQDHLRILSGLHGLLRPLDLIRPYRLEMGTRLPVRRKKNLYDFWDNKITDAVNDVLSLQKEKVLVNLASNEYFKAINPKKLAGEILTCSFKEFKNGEYKSIMTFAKKARGMMSAFIIKNRIEEVEKLKLFDTDGYAYNDRLSTIDNWTFTRG